MKNSIKDKYNLNGYVVLKNFFSKSDISFAKKQVQQYINKINKKNLSKNKGSINFSKNKINSIHTLYSQKGLFKKMYNNSKLNSVLKNLLGKKINLRAIELFAKPPKHGLPSPMHQDNFYCNLKNGNGLTVWICLDRSNSNNGGISYVPKSHKDGVLSHEPSYAPGSSQKISKKILSKILKKNKLQTPNLKSGDICIHSCLIVHGSSKNISNLSRKGLTFQFKNSKDQYDYKKIKDYRNSLKRQISIRTN